MTNLPTPNDDAAFLVKVLTTLYHSYNGATGSALPIDEALTAIQAHYADRITVDEAVNQLPEKATNKGIIALDDVMDRAWHRGFNAAITQATANIRKLSKK